MSNPIPSGVPDAKNEVSPKSIASIINHMIRVFILPQANKPEIVVKESKDIDYEYIDFSYKIKGNPSTDQAKFVGTKERLNVRWEAIQTTRKPKKYNYTWDDSNTEKDHIIEVQHVIKMLLSANIITETGWSNIPLATIIHLGYYLNDPRNLWSIPKAYNQAKAYIPLAYWYGLEHPKRKSHTKLTKPEELPWENLQGDLVKEYLFAFCTVKGKTPFSGLATLAAEMAGLPYNTMTWLTIRAGKEICALLKSWAGTIEGIAKKDLEDLEALYHIDQNPDPERYGNKRKDLKLHERADKGLALFARDAAKTATYMSWDIAIQTDPQSKPIGRSHKDEANDYGSDEEVPSLQIEEDYA